MRLVVEGDDRRPFAGDCLPDMAEGQLGNIGRRAGGQDGQVDLMEQFQPLTPLSQGLKGCFPLSLSCLAPVPLLNLQQRSLDGRDQSSQAVLEHIISGAVLEGLDGPLLPDRSRDKDEGHLRADLLGQGQGRGAIEEWQGVVREDEVRPVRVEFLAGTPRTCPPA